MNNQRNYQRRKKRRRRRNPSILPKVIILILIILAIVLVLFLIGRKRKQPNSVKEEPASSSSQETAGVEGETAEAIPTPADTAAVEASSQESASAGSGSVSSPDPFGFSGGEVVSAEPDAELPAIDPDSWELILANPTHSIQDYQPEVEPYEDVYLDKRIIPAMEDFVTTARNLGLEVVLNSGYRSYGEQQELFEAKIAQYDGDEETAATIVARPGTSEHQTGLAADITDGWYELKTQDLENTELYQWMSAHCHEFGFIVRFPKGKEDITGIIYEPWHFRYVGVDAATYIMEHDLTLEEFLELYQQPV